MHAFIITNTTSGHVLGVYPGESAGQAYELMAIDAGYDNADDMHEQTESDDSDMQIDALDASFAVHEAFLWHSIGSTRFIEQIETHGGYEISRTEIERIARAVEDLCTEDWERAEAFHAIWDDERWWRDAQDYAPDSADVRAALRAGDADVLARHTIDGMTENYTLNNNVPAEAEQADIDSAVSILWGGASDAVEIYCEPPTYSNDGETLAPLSDDLIDAITARVDAWMVVARQHSVAS